MTTIKELEETAKNYAEKVGNVTGKGWLYDAVKFGANWQAERSYSEEEVLEILFELSCNNDTDKEEMEEWFEQFKKK